MSISKIQLVGRSGSHFTRVAAMFAETLGVPYEPVTVYDLGALDADTYLGNPVLKIPTLLLEESDGTRSSLFGTENICRKFAELSSTQCTIVWPEQLTATDARCAQELVEHAMAAQVQLIIGLRLAKLPPDNLLLAKARIGLIGALTWLDEHLDAVRLRIRGSKDDVHPRGALPERPCDHAGQLQQFRG